MAVAVATLMGLAACGEGDDGAQGVPGPTGSSGTPGTDGVDGLPAFQRSTVYVASNGTSDTNVRVRNESLGLLNSYSTGGNEGLLVNAAGQLVQAGDLAGAVGIYTVCNAATRSTGDATRVIAGASTSLATPKGLVSLGNTGLVLAATNTATLLVFGSAAAGDVAPVATITLSSNAWDAAYDAAADRLFVAQTNGSVAVIDDFAATLPSNPTPRVFTASTAGTVSNFHGIAYDRSGDRLIVSDVGSASDATDGKLYVFTGASAATGAVVPAVTLGGAATLLGNPVDVVLDGTDVRVAEKSNDAILTYRNIFESAGGNLAPDVVFATTKPESLAIVRDAVPAVGATDIIDPTTPYRLLSTSNPAVGSPTSGMLYASSRSLGSPSVPAFDASGVVTPTSIENVTLDRNGDAYLTFDDNTTANSGIAVIGSIGSRPGGTYSSSRDRIISGPATTLASPKGIEVADDLGLLIVAENGGAKVLVFSACASGNAAPMATLTPAAAPWDSDYDPITDTLFVALTNGQVEAYDHFSINLGASTPRTIVPAQAGVAIAAPTNIHGIRYDQRSDTLILSDVGSGAITTDGALMTIPFASSASGLADVGKRIAGASSALGNPVDIAFDGVDLYVAEKSNSQLQVWRNFLVDPALDGDVAPSATVAATAPESLVLMRNY